MSGQIQMGVIFSKGLLEGALMLFGEMRAQAAQTDKAGGHEHDK